MEAFYGRKRDGEVKTAGGSVVAYERWRETGDQQILDEIEDYNRIDCISTEELRDWLVGIRPAGPVAAARPGCRRQGGRGGRRYAGAAARLAAACRRTGRRCCSTSASSTSARPSLRNGRCSISVGKDEDDLIDDLDASGRSGGDRPGVPVKRSFARSYRFPPQETKLRAGKKATVPVFDGPPVDGQHRGDGPTSATDHGQGGPAKAHLLSDRLTLHPDWPLNTDVIAAALRDVIDDQCGPRRFTAVDDLLSRAPPRLTGGADILNGADPVAGTIAAVAAMDDTVLPIQGPPGTGKTYVTARAILSLVRRVIASAWPRTAMRLSAMC